MLSQNSPYDSALHTGQLPWRAGGAPLGALQCAAPAPCSWCASRQPKAITVTVTPLVYPSPCFKTGDLKAFCQHLDGAVPEGLKSALASHNPHLPE